MTVILMLAMLIAFGSSFALSEKAAADPLAIAGKVTHGTTPLNHIMVTPFDVDTGMPTTDNPPYTGSDGAYTINSGHGIVPGGEYVIFFYDETGAYGCEWYNNKGTYTAATAVTTGPGNINADLDAGATIRGVVAEEGSNVPIPNATVDVYDSTDWIFLCTTTTDSSGIYTAKGLRAGTSYKIYATPPSGSIWMARWYGGALVWSGAKTALAGTQSANIYLYPKQKPRLDSVSPSSGSQGAQVTVKGEWFGNNTGAATIGFGAVAATDFVSWSNTQVVLKVPSGPFGECNVQMATGRGTSGTKPFTITAPYWYLAEGTSDWGFDTYVTIENPNPKKLTAKLTYMTKAGPKVHDNVPLPPNSQTVINPRNDLGATDFSTMVECKQGNQWITVDRRMIWRGQGAASAEGHASVGVTNPSTTWFLAEGSSKWGFETWLLVQNPSAQAANVVVTYMPDGGTAKSFTKAVPAQSRRSFSMQEDMGAVDASIKVESETPVIAERAMYRNNRREGHDSVGTATPARDFYLAEGTTDYGFTTYVLVQNPNDAAVQVSLTYMTKTGPVTQPTFTMAAKTRKTVRVNDVVPAKDLSTHVHGSLPIIAERAMYWGGTGALGEACHDSIGLNSPHLSFYMPDGETQNGYETWTLVQNPNSAPVKVEISYLTTTGAGNKSLTDTINANSRKTYFMADAIPNGRASITVKSKTAGKPIMVERAMYWNSRGAGTDTIGGFTDW
jgi:hypothetical protein